jgi:hypothetical protein
MDVANWKIKKTVIQITRFAICRIQYVGCIKQCVVSEVTTRRSDDSCMQRVARGT